ncbi:peptidoglycan DD-metalloendopeptidase family protein [Vibrio gangliei]|uniref:peptidoglycan DD-metalloendopeptidase family protein n=1 Tax=Vibrio gangliei TaxID=2077090 RepID=UPI000D01A9AA|nr:peptidoglycan DD-metalloendopeptidase family protein [Vibrio gangliei]
MSHLSHPYHGANSKRPLWHWAGGVALLLLIVMGYSSYRDHSLPTVHQEALLERNDPELTLSEVIYPDIPPQTNSHHVQTGETLATIFKLYGLDPNELLLMIKTNPQAIQVAKGQVVEWTQDDDGQLLELQIHRNARLSSVYVRKGSEFLFRPYLQQGITQTVVKSGVVTRNFYQSVMNSGLTPSQIQTIANVLYWQVDVTQSGVIGDTFAIEVEQPVVGGQPFGQGKVAAIWLRHQGQDLQWIRFAETGFYDQHGLGAQKSLMRLPVTQSYPISSDFNPHRLNPVTHQYAPHYGTDIATPLGTPVIATGDGVVMKAGLHPLAGQYLVLRNGRNYSTHFFHLSRIFVKAGEKVKQGQRIALTGNSGRSTGPHLHYELRHSGQPIDAMQAPLPQQLKISSKDQIVFQHQFTERMSQLARFMHP